MSAALSKSSLDRPTAGATYKLVVRSAEEAVQTIREKLGERAKVLSVRQLPGQGLAGLFGRPKLEVIAQIDSDDAVLPAIAMSAPANAEAALVAGSMASDAATLSLSTSAEARADVSATDRSFGAASGLSANGSARAAGLQTGQRLPDLLRRSGFSESFVGRWQSSASFAQSSSRPLHHALADFGQNLRAVTTAKSARALPARTAFLGTAGSGRTTALSKWLAREVFARGRSGKVVKAEFDRPNPGEGLAVFCEALGLSLEHYAPSEAGPSLVAGANSKDFLYVDLPGISARNPSENAAVRKFLQTEKIDGRVLVLNAVYDLPTLRQAYAAGRDLGATHLVFTHLDELGHWGKLWDFLIDGELTPLFLATGPSLTGDLEEDTIAAVIRKTLPGA